MRPTLSGCFLFLPFFFFFYDHILLSPFWEAPNLSGRQQKQSVKVAATMTHFWHLMLGESGTSQGSDFSRTRP
ncbi:hypothetical protein ASPBRDRAFT_231583 [Aspergillus brasiliensis CBS 101740]|uniref:Uncharacterized protein n=1 Tax=Aspergillus brasiliensis (strain CBS 101740 / IMI 381727 / IBT 21946) TaxID=767769 RepID=A0A1L9V0B0_ASPBC|nr:hypothetical protein ASPBRDRAFT_231583 [Aspergillus brasiliensis CBS 101740]